MNDTNKVAIVTGASRGIGAGIATRLAADGYTVVINFASNAAEAEKLVAQIEAAGGRATPAQADVSDPAAVARMFDAAQAAFGGVDVIVNNAGIMGVKSLAESDDKLFDDHIAINLKGSFNMMREAAKRMREGGRIINVSSSVIGFYHPNYSVYAATKGGIEAMTHILAKELGSRGITVNAIAPGPTATDLFFKGKPQQVIDTLTNVSPLKRLGTPEDLAGVVAFLASPEGTWINGQIIRLNGGAV